MAAAYENFKDYKQLRFVRILQSAMGRGWTLGDKSKLSCMDCKTMINLYQ